MLIASIKTRLIVSYREQITLTMALAAKLVSAENGWLPFKVTIPDSMAPGMRSRTNSSRSHNLPWSSRNPRSGPTNQSLRLGASRGDSAECLDDQVAPLVPIEPADEEHQVGVAALQPPSGGGCDRWRRGRDDQGVLQVQSIVGAGPVEDIMGRGRDDVRFRRSLGLPRPSDAGMSHPRGIPMLEH